MQNNRRTFLKQMGGFTFGAAAFPFINPLKIEKLNTETQKVAHLSPEALAENEDFWYNVQKAWVQSPHFINLESGYFSPSPLEVLDSQFMNIRKINETPSFYMRREQFKKRTEVKKILADFAGCSPEEMAITRNTTESLDTIISGLILENDAEVIMSPLEYPSMIQAFEQRARRFGLTIRNISLPLIPENMNDIFKLYEQAITPKTKVILISHMIFLTGMILPIREICDMAHERGVEVIVDAAHSFAHLDYKIPDLHCDYFGASLHKWMCAPLGTGILYVKKDKIKNVWPLFGDTQYPDDDIRKFEHKGTHPCSSELTIVNAIKFHNAIGSKRKEERLRYLKNYWAEKLSVLPGVKLNTPLNKNQSCALANLAVEGKTPNELANYLFDKHKIFTVAINGPEVKGIRVAPNLFTSLNDLDRFIEAIEELVA